MHVTPALRRRMQRVRYLLESHDEIYERELSRGERSITGFSDPRARRMKCGLCAGQGCEKCEKGRVEVVERDAYDDGEKGFWAGPEPKTMSAQQVDRALAEIRENELKRTGVYAQHLDFEVALIHAEQRDRRGSYRALRAALDFLPSRLRGEAAIRWLAEHIPGSLQVPWEAFEREQAELDAQVLALKRDGLSRQEIADALEIHPSRVRSTLKREKTA